MLTEQKKLVARNYLAHFKITKAMVDAGYAKSTADKNGYKLLTEPEFAAYLKQLMDKQETKQAITAERVIEELRRLALSDLSAYYKWHPTKKRYVLKPFDELTPEQTAAISKYEPGKGYTLYNKDGALDKLAKYFKLYSEIDQVITSFVLMPELRIGGKIAEFNIGEPVKKKDKKS